MIAWNVVYISFFEYRLLVDINVFIYYLCKQEGHDDPYIAHLNVNTPHDKKQQDMFVKHVCPLSADMWSGYYDWLLN
jgi:hypothetical protein